jgi:hypothetical protein
MAANTKTPLQAVVGVICDCLCELPPEDQTRALEAVRVTLGLRASTNTSTSTQDRNPFQETRLQRSLPTVEVQMVGDRPVVVNPPTDTAPTETPRQGFVVAGPLRVTVLRPRQHPHGVAQGTRSPGYVRLSWRDRYE